MSEDWYCIEGPEGNLMSQTAGWPKEEVIRRFTYGRMRQWPHMVKLGFKVVRITVRKVYDPMLLVDHLRADQARMAIRERNRKKRGRRRAKETA